MKGEDVVVTVPKTFTHPNAPGRRGLAAWLAEGDPPGADWSGQEWWFTTHGFPPVRALPGVRVYVVCEGRLVGYSPLIRAMCDPTAMTRAGTMPVAFVRGGGAVACTLPIPTPIQGFRGYRYRWWDRSAEVPLDLSRWL